MLRRCSSSNNLRPGACRNELELGPFRGLDDAAAAAADDDPAAADGYDEYVSRAAGPPGDGETR